MKSPRRTLRYHLTRYPALLATLIVVTLVAVAGCSTFGWGDDDEEKFAPTE